jgi:putative component of membrane protein insertase Oxa1/YidC/SpoIIIJ protein YidD
MKIFFILLFSACTANISAQTDWVKWEKANMSYSNDNEQLKRDYSISGESFSEAALKSLASAYWFFISDLDGDNCPFRPSCSNFFIGAVKETNLPHGVLIFFDRFTRDLNIFNRANKYPHFGAKYYYDPVSLYTFVEDKIHYLPPNTFIKSE